MVCLSKLHLISEIGVEPPNTLRADPMREFRLSMGMEVAFELIPVARIVTNLLTRRADRYQATQGLDVRQGLLELANQLLTLGLSALPLGDLLLQLLILRFELLFLYFELLLQLA